MAIFTATQNGDMDSAATFGGAGTPVSGDEIALGGYTVSCSSDKRALASGISISGTGTLLIKSGGALKTAVSLPNTCTLQFGEPEGTGDGPLPAVGSLDANASGEVLLNGNIAVLGPCVVYATKRSGRGYGIVTGTTSSTISIMDEATTDWQAGDAVTPIGLINAHEYIVGAWDSGAKQLTHSAVASGYNAVGVLMARMSCAAHIRRIVLSKETLVPSGISGQGDIYLYSLSNTTSHGCAGALALNGRLATLMRAGSLSSHTNAISAGYGVIAELMTPGQISGYSVSRLAIGGGVIRTLGYESGFSATMCISDALIMGMIVPPAIGYKFNVTFCDCVLPSPLISGSLAGPQTIRVMSSSGISDVLHSAGGVATKVQHASLPGTNDLPDAFLLAPVSGRAVYDYFITVRRGQTVRIRYHAWRSSAGARCGYDIYDAALGVEGVSQPLQSYELSTDTDILEWQRPTPEIYCNTTERDLLLLVRAWASGDNVYARCAPEQGGGEL